MPYARTNHHEIWYDTAGDSGPPVLLVMGFTMRGEAWRWQIDEFARHHRVAWFDHAGLGESGPLSTRRLRMHHLASDAVGVMDALGWDDAHVVGISMGGMIAQHIGLDARRRVRSLTLAATHPGGLRAALPPREGIRAFLEARLSRSSRRRLDALARLLFGPELRDAEPDRVRELLRADFTRPPAATTMLAQMHAIARHRTDHRLHELSELPVLVIRPGEDVLIDPGHSDRIIERLPRADVLRVDDSGHAVSRERPDLFNEAVLRHLADAEASRR